MTQPVCVIVGAGPGNGAAFARRFAVAGHPVALLARDQSDLASLAAEIPGTRGYACDATDAAQVKASFGRIRAELGPVGVLIYNASTRGFADIDHTTPEAFEQAWRVSALGCLLAAQQAIPDHAPGRRRQHRDHRGHGLPQGGRRLRRLRRRQGRPAQLGPVPGPAARPRGHPCRPCRHRRGGGHARLPGHAAGPARRLLRPARRHRRQPSISSPSSPGPPGPSSWTSAPSASIGKPQGHPGPPLRACRAGGRPPYRRPR